MQKNVTVINHPLISHKVALLRDKNTNTKQFRELVEEISTLLTYEAFKDIPTITVDVETPLERTKQQMIAENSVAVIPILRAGLGMVNGVHTLFPTAKVGHIGMYRDEETCRPQEYYCKLPQGIENKICICNCVRLAVCLARHSKFGYRGARSAKLLFLPERQLNETRQTPKTRAHYRQYF